MARSTSGEVAGLSNRPEGIETPTGYLIGQVVEQQTRQAQNLVPTTGREGAIPSLAT